MDTGEAIAQRNTTHKATQDSRSEAGQLVQGERNRACTGCRTAAQLARKRMTGEKKARQCRGSAMAHRRNSAVIPCADTGPWGALARMDTSEAIVQRNTAHKATQDSGSSPE